MNLRSLACLRWCYELTAEDFFFSIMNYFSMGQLNTAIKDHYQRNGYIYHTWQYVVWFRHWTITRQKHQTNWQEIWRNCFDSQCKQDGGHPNTATNEVMCEEEIERLQRGPEKIIAEMRVSYRSVLRFLHNNKWNYNLIFYD